MDSLIFELQIVLYFQLFLSANVRHNTETAATKLNLTFLTEHASLLRMLWNFIEFFTLRFSL